MSEMTTPRLTLRQLPLPVRLVLTTFLFSVGIGYTSAMIQLHMQHTDRDGNPLPTPENVIERFSGLAKAGDAPPKSKLEQIISGPKTAGFDKNSMVKAFFEKSSGYDKEIKKRSQAEVDAERETERDAMIAWITAKEDIRKKAYHDGETGKFVLPDSFKGRPITEEFYEAETHSLFIKTLIEERCIRCHDGNQKPDMDSYDKLLGMLPKDEPELIDGKWVRSGKQMTIEGLAQSSHVHLLGFAVLYGFTGLIFAFTSLPGILRGTIGPIVLIAQVVDISFWWLARLDSPYGPMFAQMIMASGAVVAMGLLFQIVVSTFDMYPLKGKLVVLMMYLAAAGAAVPLYTQVISPALKAEKEAAEKAKNPEPKIDEGKQDESDKKKD